MKIKLNKKKFKTYSKNDFIISKHSLFHTCYKFIDCLLRKLLC